MKNYNLLNITTYILLAVVDKCERAMTLIYQANSDLDLLCYYIDSILTLNKKKSNIKKSNIKKTNIKKFNIKNNSKRHYCVNAGRKLIKIATKFVFPLKRVPPTVGKKIMHKKSIPYDRTFIGNNKDYDTVIKHIIDRGSGVEYTPMPVKDTKVEYIRNFSLSEKKNELHFHCFNQKKEVFQCCTKIFNYEIGSKSPVNITCSFDHKFINFLFNPVSKKITKIDIFPGVFDLYEGMVVGTIKNNKNIIDPAHRGMTNHPIIATKGTAIDENENVFYGFYVHNMTSTSLKQWYNSSLFKTVANSLNTLKHAIKYPYTKYHNHSYFITEKDFFKLIELEKTKFAFGAPYNYGSFSHSIDGWARGTLDIYDITKKNSKFTYICTGHYKGILHPEMLKNLFLGKSEKLIAREKAMLLYDNLSARDKAIIASKFARHQIDIKGKAHAHIGSLGDPANSEFDGSIDYKEHDVAILKES